jgi:acetyltransferase-like isoleucine patch superfamily enzyme
MFTRTGSIVERRFSATNRIGKHTQIAFGVSLGEYNEIGDSVRILRWGPRHIGVPFRGEMERAESAFDTKVSIGDNNIIHDGVRIIVGPGPFSMGDWNVIHDNCSFLGNGMLSIGHNCWFGQGCYVDCRGGVIIHDGARFGTQAHIWSHAASGELIEGCLINYEKPTEIGKNAWIVGDHVSIMPGVSVGERSVILPHSVVTKSTTGGLVYSGTPAKFVVGCQAWRTTSIDEKFNMMAQWAEDFRKQHSGSRVTHQPTRTIIEGYGGCVIVGKGMPESVLPTTTFFDLVTKTYTKRLTVLERMFYSFLYGNRARFTPAGEAF